MRQAGILAAAGIVALTEMVDRLADDHENARILAEGIEKIEGLSIAPDRVSTNIVYIDVIRKNLTAKLLTEKLDGLGIRMLATGPKQLRAVTNYHVTSEGIAYALTAISKIMNLTY